MQKSSAKVPGRMPQKEKEKFLEQEKKVSAMPISEANLAMVLVLRSEELGRSGCMGAQATYGGVQDSPSPGP